MDAVELRADPSVLNDLDTSHLGGQPRWIKEAVVAITSPNNKGDYTRRYLVLTALEDQCKWPKNANPTRKSGNMKMVYCYQPNKWYRATSDRD